MSEAQVRGGRGGSGGPGLGRRRSPSRESEKAETLSLGMFLAVFRCAEL